MNQLICVQVCLRKLWIPRLRCDGRDVIMLLLAPPPPATDDIIALPLELCRGSRGDRGRFVSLYGSRTGAITESAPSSSKYEARELETGGLRDDDEDEESIVSLALLRFFVSESVLVMT